MKRARGQGDQQNADYQALTVSLSVLVCSAAVRSQNMLAINCSGFSLSADTSLLACARKGQLQDGAAHTVSASICVTNQ